MIGHQHAGVDGNAVIIRRFVEPVQVAIIIIVGKEAGRAVIAPLDNMMGRARKIDAWMAGHANSLVEVPMVRKPFTDITKIPR